MGTKPAHHREPARPAIRVRSSPTCRRQLPRSRTSARRLVYALEPVATGGVRVVKRVEAEGGIAPLVRLFVPKMRRDIAESLAALGRVAAAAPPGLASRQ